MTEKKVHCPCGTDCKCDPCECNTEKSGCCGKGKTCCTPGHHFWLSATVRIILVVAMIVGAYAWGVWNGGSHSNGYDRYDRDGYGMMGRGYNISTTNNNNSDNEMLRHCQMMPNMAGCEAYLSGNTSSTGAHDMMDMSMRDMGKMLEGKTGDELNKAFLEGMIPHHQGAVEMAKYLAGSNKPELVKLGADIIAAQTKEIEQMQNWMKEWGYTK